MVHLGILAHELSQLEGKPDQYTGFPTDIKNIGGGGGFESIHGEHGEASKKRENILLISVL